MEGYTPKIAFVSDTWGQEVTRYQEEFFKLINSNNLVQFASLPEPIVNTIDTAQKVVNLFASMLYANGFAVTMFMGAEHYRSRCRAYAETSGIPDIILAEFWRPGSVSIDRIKSETNILLAANESCGVHRPIAVSTFLQIDNEALGFDREAVNLLSSTPGDIMCFIAEMSMISSSFHSK